MIRRLTERIVGAGEGAVRGLIRGVRTGTPLRQHHWALIGFILVCSLLWSIVQSVVYAGTQDPLRAHIPAYVRYASYFGIWLLCFARYALVWTLLLGAAMGIYREIDGSGQKDKKTQ